MTRRSIVALCSVCIHAIILVFAMTADLWRPVSLWPTPRSAMAFEPVTQPVHVEDIQVPVTAGRRQPGPASTGATSPGEFAPVVPPAGMPDETGGERALSNLPPGPPIAPNSGDLGTIGIATLPPAPPAPPQPTGAVRLHSGIRPPQRVYDVRPVYPAIARSAHVEGIVILEIVIDERGSVTKAEVLRSVPLLDAAALEAVRQWRFSPTQLNGIAVPIVMTVTVNFSLK